jgi:Fe-S oxidoreductase
VDTWTNYCTPEVGIATVTLLERAGFRVHCPVLHCCGRPAISQGLLSEAKELAEGNVRLLAHVAPPGVPIVGTEPSCLLTLLDEYPQLVRTGTARRIASQVVTIEQFLARTIDQLPLASEPRASARADSTPFAAVQGESSPLTNQADVPQVPPESLERRRGASGERNRPTLLYHAHCHQKALVGTDHAVALLQRVWGERATLIDAGCCGMAGSFGHEQEHYDVAKAMGEDRLFPAIRRYPSAGVAVSGFSCRTQIGHHTDARPRHLVEFLADALR